MNFEDLEVGMKLRVTKTYMEMRSLNSYQGSADYGQTVTVKELHHRGASSFNKCHFTIEEDADETGVWWMSVDFVEPAYDWLLNPDMKTFGETPREFQMKFFEARLDGETIQNEFLGDWADLNYPSFGLDAVYRVKPKKTPEQIEMEELEAKIPTLRSEFAEATVKWAELSKKEGKSFRDCSREEKGAILLARHENMRNVQFWSVENCWKTSDRHQTPNIGIYRIKPEGFDLAKEMFEATKADLDAAVDRLEELSNPPLPF